MAEETMPDTNAHPSGRDELMVARAERRKGGEILDEDRETYVKWHTAKDYAALLRTNRAFLRDELEFSPYHKGPIYKETMAMMPALLRLHDYGMLTLGSQPHAVERVDPQCDCCKGKDAMITQLPFLSFLLPVKDPSIAKATVQQFAVELLTDDNCHVFFLKFEDRFMDSCVEHGLRSICNFPEDWGTHLKLAVSAV